MSDDLNEDIECALDEKNTWPRARVEALMAKLANEAELGVEGKPDASLENLRKKPDASD
jgi:hypothetical protein